MKRKSPKSQSVRSGDIHFLRSNAGSWESRNLYRSVLSLSWPAFIVWGIVGYLLVNAVFACLFLLGGNCIEGEPNLTFSSAFYFSVQTLSTVGYGHLYPATHYANAVATVEFLSGMFFTALITGLIFVRFSRPKIHLRFSKPIVISTFNGQPSLEFRVANLQLQPMVEARFRLMMIRRESILEDDDLRRFHDLKLDFNHLITFPMAVTLRHLIDESSPLHGVKPGDLEQGLVRFIASVVCIDTVIQAPVQSQHHYSWLDVRFGQRFVEIYRDLEGGRMEVDYGLLHDTAPIARA